jgi:cytochrome c oxidase accessory protein FixG
MPPDERRHLPVIEKGFEKSSIRRDGSRAFVYPADVSGRFATARKVVFAALIVIYAALPWVPVGGHPAVFLDIERRSFFLFGATFNAQDLWLVAFLATGACFGLVVLTALAGRLWCGWACPQTVFLEGVFRPIERFFEGSREKRMRRKAGPMTFDRLWRRTAVLAAYLVLAFVVAHVCLAYFVSIPRLFDAMRQRPAEHPEAFAVVMSLTGILFFDFAWFREQFCVILCPYGRLQSALLDPDSLVVGYDRARGEPRGKATQKAKGAALGDCVDCNRCVVVCPTGIDIREGLQMDCLACTACIDACDDIMDKLGRPRGLIRYDSQNGLAGERRRILRPRLVVYAVLGAIGLVAATLAFRSRQDFEANVLRVQGPPYMLEGSVVRNAFTIHLVNKRSTETVYRIEPEPILGADFVIPVREARLASLAQVTSPVFVSIPRADFRSDFVVRLRIVPDGRDSEAQVVTAPFLGPGAK